MQLHASRELYQQAPPTTHALSITPHARTHRRSSTPYQLRRDFVGCLLVLATGSRSNQKTILQYESQEFGPGGEREGMAQLLFGKLLRTCGDYVMQVGASGDWLVCTPRAALHPSVSLGARLASSAGNICRVPQ